MPEPQPVTSRPIVAPPSDPVLRLTTPAATTGSGPVAINHPVFLPEPEDESGTPTLAGFSRLAGMSVSAPKRRWYQRFARPSAYVVSGLAGAALVTALYGLLGSRSGLSGGRGNSDSAPGAVPASDTALLDRRADTLALAITAFGMRANMFDSRRMPCTGLGRGLAQVEDAWLEYNLARRDLLAASD